MPFVHIWSLKTPPIKTQTENKIDQSDCTTKSYRLFEQKLFGLRFTRKGNKVKFEYSQREELVGETY